MFWKTLAYRDELCTSLGDKTKGRYGVTKLAASKMDVYHASLKDS